MKWNKCDGTIWDYQKTFYLIRLHSGEERWAYPNAGRLTDVGFGETSGDDIPVESVALYRADEELYFESKEKLCPM